MALPIRGKSRGTWQAAAEQAIAAGGVHPDRIRRYARSLWQACERLGIRADVAWAQALVECSTWRGGRMVPFSSPRWVDEGNPAGMGITNDKPASEPGETGSPEWWGIVHATHLGGYAGIMPPDEWRAMDFRWAAMIGEGYFGVAETAHDLDERWAKDGPQQYGDVIESRWRGYFADAEVPIDEPGEGSQHMNVAFEQRIATRRLGGHTAKLANLEAWFTIHENGNGSSSPYDEAAFVNNGGGGQGVLYHFAVGVENGRPTIVQIFPVDRRGIHAGNATGNATAAAVETCVAPPGALSDMTQAALRELLYMLYTHDPRIDWGDDRHRFSPDRTNMHASWRGANPGCPANMLRAWGGIDPVVNSVRQRLTAGGGGTTTPIEEVATGDTVATIVPLNARAEPSTSAAIVTLLAVGTDAIVTGSSVERDGYEWLPVTLGDGRPAWLATGGDDGAYLTVIARAEPPEEDTDEPEEIGGLPIALARALFGAYETDAMRYEFNPEGVVSEAWLDYGAEEDRYPALAEVHENLDGLKVFRFADGLVLAAPVDRPGEIERLETGE